MLSQSPLQQNQVEASKHSPMYLNHKSEEKSNFMYQEDQSALNEKLLNKKKDLRQDRINALNDLKIQTGYKARSNLNQQDQIFPRLQHQGNGTNSNQIISSGNLQFQTEPNPIFSPKSEDQSRMFNLHSSNQKKRAIRVQSKNKFPSDFFQQQQQDEDQQELNAILHPPNHSSSAKNQEQIEELPQIKKQSHSHPMKLSLPIPSSQDIKGEVITRVFSQKNIIINKNQRNSVGQQNEINISRPISSEVQRTRIESPFSPQNHKISKETLSHVQNLLDHQISHIDVPKSACMAKTQRTIGRDQKNRILSSKERNQYSSEINLQEKLQLKKLPSSNQSKNTIPSYKLNLAHIQQLPQEDNQIKKNFGSVKEKSINQFSSSSNSQQRLKMSANPSTTAKRKLTYDLKMMGNNNKLHEMITSNQLQNKEGKRFANDLSYQVQLEEEEQQQCDPSLINQSSKVSQKFKSQSLNQNDVINQPILIADQSNEAKLNLKQIKLRENKVNIDFSNFKISTSSMNKQFQPGSTSFKFSNNNLVALNHHSHLKLTEQRLKQRPQSMIKLDKVNKEVSIIEAANQSPIKKDSSNCEPILNDTKKVESQTFEFKFVNQKDETIGPLPQLKQFFSEQERCSSKEKKIISLRQKSSRTANSRERSLCSPQQDIQNKISDSNDSYNKTANFNSLSNLEHIPINAGRLKLLKSQPKLALNSKESEKYKPFLIRKVSSQSSQRTKQSGPQSGSPNSANSLQTFTFEFNKNISGSTNPGISLVSSPTLLASNDQFNSHEFSFSNQ